MRCPRERHAHGIACLPFKPPLPSASAALRSLHPDNSLSAPADLAPAIPIAPWLTTELTTEPMRTESPMRALTHPGGTRAWGATFT